LANRCPNRFSKPSFADRLRVPGQLKTFMAGLAFQQQVEGKAIHRE
jgi:hypothetical protein